ncbi:MAG: LamG-like jellyroll fold domain-containing protein, partial [Myxococcota bacterium]|nr:LamG-like jellyroll fold domain-containing protein [Myxococcota bacterium]
MATCDGTQVGYGLTHAPRSHGNPNSYRTIYWDGVEHSNSEDQRLQVFFRRPVCGNGVVQAGEACDDGNGVEGDGCTPECKKEPWCDALSFDGSDDYVTPGLYGEILGGETELTVELWIRPHSYPDDYYGNGLDIFSTTCDYIGLGINGEGRAHVRRWPGVTMVGSTTMETNTWNHIAMTTDQSTDGTTRLWVNGKEDGSEGSGGALVGWNGGGQVSSERIHIGGEDGGSCLHEGANPSSALPDYFFDGDIGAVRFSRGTRYTSSFVPNTMLLSDADTLLLYDMSQGPGQDTLQDASPGDHDGAMEGPTWSLDGPQ